jgi:methyl-accepting chemotaxis protein
MNRMRLSLGAKLLGLVAVLCSMTLIVVLAAISALSSVAADGHRGYRKSTLALDALSSARGTYNFNRALSFKHILEPGSANMTAVWDQIHANDKIIAGAMKRYEATIQTADGRAVFTKLNADISLYINRRDQELVMSARGRKVGAYKFAAVQVTPIGNRVTAGFDDLQARKRTQAAAADKAAGDEYQSARTLVIALLVLALAIGATLAVIVARGIRGSARSIVATLSSLRENDTARLQHALGRLADGDLTVEAQAETAAIASWSNDELGDIAQAVNAVRDNTAESMAAYNSSREALATMVAQVAGTASTVSSASQQMASTSDEAGRAVAEIAHAVGEVAAGSQKQVIGIEDARRLTDEVAEATSRSAEDASQTALAADEARRIAVEGAAAVGEATEAMASVRDASGQATEAIRALGLKSDEIGGIVDTIGGIAEQTNLLALNAAIEAARAGEQGRGFAVVAEEVRKLAEESQAAARSIAALIGDIQAETGRAVEVVEDGATRTNQGAATVEQARDAFRRIGGSVDDVTSRVGQIAASVQQIAASAEQMGERMADIAAVAEESSASTQEVSASTEQTSASTQEIAASAQELARTAGDLEQLVSRFTLR